IESGDRSLVAMAFCIGAGVMALGGVAELVLGVKAEGANLEDIARPLTAEDADEEAEEPTEDADTEAKETAEAGDQSAGTVQSTGAGEQKAPQSRRQKLRPGPGSAGMYSPWQSVSSRDVPPEVAGNEVQGIIDYVRDMQPVSETELYRAIGARRWGPGRFRSSVREAIRQGHIRRNRRGRLETTDH
ncbi:MAG: hypothetical protein L0J13_14125, partial [Brevibacterium sp.]|nr:hypothetical protein [Brevibacterium sp.]